MSRDERELARSAASGDHCAFALIVERYQGSVFGICRRYLAGPEAEDLAQETFVRAFVHRERFDPERPLKPWLLTIARNLCLDRLRSRERRQRPEPDMSVFADSGPDAERIVSNREQLDLLARGLEQLPDGQREAVALFHLEGLSYRELSEVLGVPIGTVMTWLHRGRRRLRDLVLAAGATAAGAARAESGGS
jgi:RNA polymerase sigma-70 factor (ECF subfamily)